MNSICLPVPLVVLLRRIFNAFSAFSISQSYLKAGVGTGGVGGSEGEDREAKDEGERDGKDKDGKEKEDGWALLDRLKKTLPSRCVYNFLSFSPE